MSRFMLLQAFYSVTGILFFVRDLFNKVPVGQGIINAFIWPYAQWPVIKFNAMQMLAPVLKAIN